WKMAGFQLVLVGVLGIYKFKSQPLIIISILLAPALLAIPYQKKLKHYPELVSTLRKEIQLTDNQSLLITNNFLEFSDQIMFPNDIESHEKLHGLDYLLDKNNPKADTIKLLIYLYYQHAYPQEEEEIDQVFERLKELGFELKEE